MGGGYEVDVRRSHFFQPAEDARQLLCAVLLSDGGAGDLVILAERAAQRAAGKEHRARPRPAGDAGLLVGMQPVFCDARELSAPARALRFFSGLPRSLRGRAYKPAP